MGNQDISNQGFKSTEIELCKYKIPMITNFLK